MVCGRLVLRAVQEKMGVVVSCMVISSRRSMFKQIIYNFRSATLSLSDDLSRSVSA